MESKETEKAPVAVSKSILAVGPTLHYSHANVQRCWLLAVIAFAVTCLVWSKLATGTFLSFDFEAILAGKIQSLSTATTASVTVFEYPWQILVLGLLMGVLSMTPILISQLMSFGHSLLFVFSVCFLANLPGIAATLLISCFAAAARVFRFRSRIIAITLCTAPQLLYWALYGGARQVEPIEWGFSFAPWFGAWLTGLVMAGVVLGIGHYTRYRPGLVWIVTGLTCGSAIGVFESKIGFDELSYQYHVAENDPEQVGVFSDRSITAALDQTITDPEKRKYLDGFYYPTEPIPLRAELKREIQRELAQDRWPTWFIVPDELKYQRGREQLLFQYDLFLSPPKPWWMPTLVHSGISKRRAAGARVPIALYYKASAIDYCPDIKMLDRDEVLHFDSDCARERAGAVWFKLYRNFPKSPESAEARWRIAKHLAGRARFDEADKLLVEAQQLVQDRLALLRKDRPVSDSLFGVFRPPADSVMTELKLTQLQRRLDEFRSLIGPQNRKGPEGAAARLAEFVVLNPHSLRYAAELDGLALRLGAEDGLRDNVLLAKALLVLDDELRAKQLTELHRQFETADGGMLALYELARLLIRQYQHEKRNVEQKKQYLVKAKSILTDFQTLYPTSYLAEQARQNLESLPKIE